MSSDAHGTTTVESSGLKQPYHLVDPSPWPIIGAVGGFMIVLGIIFAAHFGSYILLVAGALVVFTVMFLWWRDVVRESRHEAGMGDPPRTKHANEATEPHPRTRPQRPRDQRTKDKGAA